MGWLLSEHVATLQHAGLSAQVNLERPEQGLTQLQLDGQPLAGNLLRVNLGQSDPSNARRLVDFYVRGADLVATYEAPPDGRFRDQVYWRLVDAAGMDGFATIELMHSVQTSLLDSDPQRVLSSSVPHCDGGWVGEKDPALVPLSQSADGNRVTLAHEQRPLAVLCRLLDRSRTYVELLYPADLRETTLTGENGGLHIAHRLFQTSLEKGVILRSRVRAGFVAREGDIERASVEARRFAASQLPLTT